MPHSNVLVAAQTTNTTSAAVELATGESGQKKYRTLTIYGTWDGATASIELSSDNSNFCAKDHTDTAIASVTENAYFVIETAGRCWVKLVTASVGTTSLNLAEAA